ncbi:MAG TPA: hypothetical protein VII63_10665 [Caulobacteraceae bacterium]
MRLHLALSLALLAVPAAALAAPMTQDRYGPPAAPDSAAPGQVVSDATPPSAPTYRGRLLNWTNKAAIERTDRSSLDAPRVERAAAVEMAAPASPSVAAAPASIYDSAPSVTVVPARRMRAPAAPLIAVEPTPPAATVATPPPAPANPVVSEATPLPITMAAASTTSTAPVRPRFYSLHRAYGDRPDAVAIPIDRPPVLIGPADPEPSSAGDDSASGAGQPAPPAVF